MKDGKEVGKELYGVVWNDLFCSNIAITIWVYTVVSLIIFVFQLKIKNMQANKNYNF